MSDKQYLSVQNINPDPFVQFHLWYTENLGSGMPIPDSVSLATSSTDGNVSLRTVLLKEYSEEGFVFYTNYESKKGKQLLSNPRAALLFYWSSPGRQIRIEGKAVKVSEADSVNYFHTRPVESQISAWASEQSSVIPNREYLEKRAEYYREMFKGKSVDKPPHWGGFRIIPDWFEFWQNDEFRLHNRITYTKRNKSWVIERLAP